MTEKDISHKFKGNEEIINKEEDSEQQSQLQSGELEASMGNQKEKNDAKRK